MFKNFEHSIHDGKPFGFWSLFCYKLAKCLKSLNATIDDEEPFFGILFQEKIEERRNLRRSYIKLESIKSNGIFVCFRAVVPNLSTPADR